jgi:hypothetical protein
MGLLYFVVDYEMFATVGNRADEIPMVRQASTFFSKGETTRSILTGFLLRFDLTVLRSIGLCFTTHTIAQQDINGFDLNESQYQLQNKGA